MFVRRALLAATALGLAFVAPASADITIGYHTQIAGFVVSGSHTIDTSPEVPEVPEVPEGSEEIAGKCTYAGATTPSGNIIFGYGGSAEAYSTTSDQPQLVVVECTLISPAQGLPGERPTLEASFEVACPGAACVAGGVTAEWPLRPVKICVSGFGIFGPFNPVQRDITLACSTSPL